MGLQWEHTTPGIRTGKYSTNSDFTLQTRENDLYVFPARISPMQGCIFPCLYGEIELAGVTALRSYSAASTECEKSSNYLACFLHHTINRYTSLIDRYASRTDVHSNALIAMITMTDIYVRVHV